MFFQPVCAMMCVQSSNLTAPVCTDAMVTAEYVVSLPDVPPSVSKGRMG